MNKRGLMMMMNHLQKDTGYFNIPSCINCKHYLENQNIFQSQCKKFNFELAVIVRSQDEKCGIIGKYYEKS